MRLSAKRLQQTLATKQDWLINVRRVAYNRPVIDSSLTPKYKPKTLVIRSGKLSSSLLFELDDFTKKLADLGYDVVVHKNPSGGYNYDTVVDNEDTRTSIRTILGFFEELKKS